MKQKIMNYLLGQAGQPVSGAKLAEMLGISRVMVHKYISRLRDEGYRIDAEEGRGYCLIWPENEVNPVKVKSLLNGEFGKVMDYVPEVNSTQDVLLELVHQGKGQHGQVITAALQTAGKGRRGRHWIAETGGLWFSILLHTAIPMVEIPRLSLLFSLAVVQALKPWCPSVTIKWPNDIMADGCKLGGLLLNLEGEPGNWCSLVVGVGINVNCPVPALPTNNQIRATSLLKLRRKTTPIDPLFAAILSSMEALYNSYLVGSWDEIINEYRNNCAHIGQTITVNQGDKKLTGLNSAITREGSLELIQNGEVIIVHSGDVI